MLSQSEKLNGVTNDPNANRFVVRLKFRKIGNLQYISHLDLQRTFNRVIKRSGIPAWYTQGFNPHLKLVFSSPLSIGTESVCEYLDLSMQGVISCEEIMARLNAELTDELYITEAYIPTTKFADIAWADYTCEIFTEGASEALAEAAQKLLATSPVMMTKNTKAGEKEIDIVELIDEVSVKYLSEKGTLVMNARLSATSTQFLNPEMLISAMKRELGILCGDPTVECYTIMRKDLLKADITSFR